MKASIHFTESHTIYGPIQSRRLGTTIGINPLGHKNKICSYNCPYCDLGETTIRMNQLEREIKFQDPESINNQFRKKLVDPPSTAIKSICVSGNGEPTLYPHFRELSEMIRDSRDELFEALKIHLFTNGAHFDQKKVMSALKYYDFIHVKLDAGDDEVLKKVNAPIVRTRLNKLLHYVRGMDNLILQSMFITGSVSNISDFEIESWMEVVGMIRPQAVHLYTVDKKPFHPGIEKVDEDTLDIIATKLRRKTQIEALVFP